MLRQSFANGLQVGTGGVHRNPALQPAYHGVFETSAVGARPEYEWNENVRRIEPGFAGRKNADDGEGAAIQLKHLPNNARIGPKAIPPEAVAQHGDVVLLARLIFVGIEKAAKGGLHAEQREKSRGSAGDGYVFGITEAGEVRVVTV